jgi:hypothetical protein
MNELGQAELEQIIVEFPTADGVSEGSLWSFYEAIGAGGIEISDDGYIWSDGTLIPTNGEPYMDVSPNDLYILMGDYITQDIEGGGDIVIDENDITDGSGDDQNNNTSLIKLAAIGLLIYVIVNVKK